MGIFFVNIRMFLLVLLSILSSSAHAWVLVEETITPNGTDIRWTERQTGPWGGGGGSDFSDSGYGNADGQCIRCAVTEMEIRHGIAIDKIRAKYGETGQTAMEETEAAQAPF